MISRIFISLDMGREGLDVTYIKVEGRGEQCGLAEPTLAPA